MNKINWHKYVDHIFCLEYLPDNRFNTISKTLFDIGINIYDTMFFSFLFDYNHCLFNDQINNIINNSFNKYNNVKSNRTLRLNNNQHGYSFYVGLMEYKALKISQYFNYERIIIFEDDIIFLKDIDYIINALDFLNTEEFDICLCQTTFEQSFHGIKSYLVQYAKCIDLDNNMFLRTNNILGVYGGSFIILTKRGINKLINYYESNDIIICLDMLDAIREDIKLDTLFALKPLCLQQHMLKWNDKTLKDKNVNINNINEYI